MKKKLYLLSLWSFVLAAGIFVLSYLMYHYMTPEGIFTLVFRQEPGKPFVTLMAAIWGVLFLFGSVMSLLIARIFFSDKPQ